MSDITIGQDGGNVITDTSIHTVPDVALRPNQCWFAVQVIADAVFNTSGTVTNLTDFSGLSGVTISAGQIIYGRFTSIQLASGKVIAYQKDV